MSTDPTVTPSQNQQSTDYVSHTRTPHRSHSSEKDAVSHYTLRIQIKLSHKVVA
nr:hypothetical protein [Psychrobacter sp. PraFG1]UNK05542.1 hypothetical protein MN210_01140 [Psychrobacter sp. PraFG1]